MVYLRLTLDVEIQAHIDFCLREETRRNGALSPKYSSGLQASYVHQFLAGLYKRIPASRSIVLPSLVRLAPVIVVAQS